MQSIPPQSDVIIAGGGLSGLAAAAYLAREGRSVTVFERRATTGGRARTRTFDGFHFNLGPHALYRTAQATEVLRDLGVPFQGGEPPTSGGYAVNAGVLHTLPVGFLSLLTTGLLRPTEKVEASKRIDQVRRLDTSGLQNIRLADWLRAEIGSETVRNLIAALVRLSTYARAPEMMSAGAAFDQVQRALTGGVLYLDGGWQTMADRLRDAAIAAGARVLTNRHVTQVLRDPDVRGVQLLDGSTEAASTVLIAGSPRMATDLTSSGPPTVLSQWAEQSLPVYAACLDVALDRLPVPKARFALGIDQPLYASVHSSAARLAPGDGALIHVARYGGLRGESAAVVEGQLAGLLDLLQPGWRNHVVKRRFLPDVVVSNAIVTAAQGGLAGRPGPAVSDVPGLYVAGDWVGPEGMLADAALASARNAARLIRSDARRPAGMAKWA